MAVNIILMSCRQRLFQVGTCIGIVPHRILQARSISVLSNGGPVYARNALARQGRVVAEQNPYESKQLLLGERESVDDVLRDDVPHRRHGTETVITVPVRLQSRLERKLVKDNTKGAKRQKIIDESRTGRKSQIIIHCKQQEFNHYYGQSYAKKVEIPLASSGWRHRKSTGDHFTIFPGFKKESPFYMSETKSLSFEELGLSTVICNNLKSMGIETPTHIQVFSIPEVLKGHRTIVAAETGCGKTLVYLLPMIQQILEDQRYRLRSKPGQPTAVILVPSRELADQIFEVAQQLTQNLDISIKLLQGGSLVSKMKNPPTSKAVDILIATTNALKVMTTAGVYGTSKILHLVLDEADTLLDDSFFPELIAPFLSRLPWDDLQRQIQLTLVSATMPRGMKSTIGQIMDVNSFATCSTPGLHRLLPHVPQKFLRVRKSQKPIKIKEMIESDVEKKVPVMIFCNKSETCDWLSHHLNGEGLDCVSVHGRMPLKYRKGRIDMYQSGEINVLISTDLASRGIDTVRTQHVVNYEFPLFLADYIHRCGRTGRVGSAGECRVTNFISRPGEVATVNNIEMSVRKEKTLPEVNANIKRLYAQKYGSFVEIQPIREDEDPTSHNEESENSKDK